MIGFLLRFWRWLLGSSVATEDEVFIPMNREMRRNAMRAQRLKGPGYTRAYRKGRKQRGGFDA